MKTIGLMVVGAMFAFSTTSAVAQTVKKTTKTHKHIVQKNNSTSTSGASAKVGSSVNGGAEYATSPRGGVNSYKEQSDENQQGASAENGEESVTITPKDQGSQPATPTTTTKKTSTKKVVATTRKQ